MESETTFRLVGKEPHLISLMLLSAFASMGAILMTPALPQISHFFSITIGTTQLTVTSFLLGYALGQLIYGPLANRLGRKPALYIGITIATIGSLFSIFSSPIESFHLLITGRFLEAIGASAGLAVSLAIINDFYYPEQARRITALLMLAFAIVPGVAIAIGGTLTQYINWQACFYFLLFYGFILIYSVYLLPETIINFDQHALHFKHIFRNYLKIFVNKKLIGYGLLTGLSSANIYVFGASGPFIGIQLLHIAPATYGLLGLIPFIGTFIGSILVVRMVNLQALLVLKIAFLIELIASLTMFLFFIFGVVTITTLLFPMGVLCIGHPILAGTGVSLAMDETEDKANGSAVLTFTGMSMPVLMTFLLSLLHVAHAWIMPLIFLISLFFMLIIYQLTLKELS